MTIPSFTLCVSRMSMYHHMRQYFSFDASSINPTNITRGSTECILAVKMMMMVVMMIMALVPIMVEVSLLVVMVMIMVIRIPKEQPFYQSNWEEKQRYCFSTCFSGCMMMLYGIWYNNSCVVVR